MDYLNALENKESTGLEKTLSSFEGVLRFNPQDTRLEVELSAEKEKNRKKYDKWTEHTLLGGIGGLTLTFWGSYFYTLIVKEGTPFFSKMVSYLLILTFGGMFLSEAERRQFRRNNLNKIRNTYDISHLEKNLLKEYTELVQTEKKISELKEKPSTDIKRSKKLKQTQERHASLEEKLERKGKYLINHLTDFDKKQGVMLNIQNISKYDTLRLAEKVVYNKPYQEQITQHHTTPRLDLEEALNNLSNGLFLTRKPITDFTNLVTVQGCEHIIDKESDLERKLRDLDNKCPLHKTRIQPEQITPLHVPNSYVQKEMKLRELKEQLALVEQENAENKRKHERIQKLSEELENANKLLAEYQSAKELPNTPDYTPQREEAHIKDKEKILLTE